MKTLLAEEIIDKFLQSDTHTIGSKEEEKTIELMRKLPSGVNEKKLLDAMIRMGSNKAFRYGNGFSKEYIPVFQEAMRSFLREPYPSQMMLQLLAFALEKDFSQAETYKDFTDTGKFLQYLDKLQFPVEKAEQFPKSDQFITAAVAEGIHTVLKSIRYTSKDIRVYNSFIYALGKANLPGMEEVILFQLGSSNNLNEMNILINALKLHKGLPNTAKGYQLVYDKLYAIQAASLSFQFAKFVGLEPDLDMKWSIKVQVSSDPEEKTPRRGWSVSFEISNMWADCINLVVNGPKGSQKGNERHGVLMGKGLGFYKIDVFKLRTAMDEIGLLYGIEQLYWENAAVSVTGFDKNAAKTIKQTLLNSQI